MSATGAIAFNSSNDRTISLTLDRVAWRADDKDELLFASFVAPGIVVKQIRAMLHGGPLKIDMHPPTEDGGRRYASNVRLKLVPGCDYSIMTHRLKFGLVHVVLMAKMDAMLIDGSDSELWSSLMKQYTTPMLRSWIPKLRNILSGLRLIQSARCRGCSVALLTGTQSEVDDAVSSAVRNGELVIA